MAYVQFINESNKTLLNKPQNSDMVYYSELTEWYTPNALRSFSIKYVIEGCINYNVENKEYSVKNGTFLLASQKPFVRSYFDSERTVRSVCIDICPRSLAEAFTVLSEEENLNFDNYCDYHFKDPVFFDRIYPLQHSMLKRKLEYITELFNTGSMSENRLNKEWFLEMVELIVLQEFENFKSLQGLNFIKSSTRKDILDRLYRGREYMNDSFLSNPEIAEVARVSGMSEFHFFRSFKQAFDTTPYQYMLTRRLNHAMELLKQSGNSITSIASTCGFPDLFTFSKSFKKKFGYSPSQFKMNAG